MIPPSRQLTGGEIHLATFGRTFPQAVICGLFSMVSGQFDIADCGAQQKSGLTQTILGGG